MLRNQLSVLSIADRQVVFHDPPMNEEGGCHDYGGSSTINWGTGTVDQCCDYAFPGYDCTEDWRYLGCVQLYGCRYVVLNLGVNDVKSVYHTAGRTMDDYVADIVDWVNAREAEGHTVFFATEYPVDRDCLDKNGTAYPRCTYLGIDTFGDFQQDPENPVAVQCDETQLPACGYEHINTNYQYVIHKLISTKPDLAVVDMFNHIRTTYTDSDVFIQDESNSSDGIHQDVDATAGQVYWATFIANELETILPPLDTDGDGIPDEYDNCPYAPNGAETGVCVVGKNVGDPCDSDAGCCTGNCVCSMNQQDSDGDGIGDACEEDNAPYITGGPVVAYSWTSLSGDPANPSVFPLDPVIVWAFNDDRATCPGGGCTNRWYYRETGTGEWQTVQPFSCLYWVWTGGLRGILGSGSFDFRFEIEDCAGQLTASETYYITLPP